MEDKSISLTYYVNPQLFWYHNSDVPDNNYAEVVRVEEALLAEFESGLNTRNKFNWQPKVGDKVVLHYLVWQKFMRGHVLEIVQYDRCTKYIVWATDHGFPVETKLERLYPLPGKFGYKIDRIRCGGLINLVPAEKELRLDRIVVAPKTHWARKSRDYFEKLVEEAARVTFIEEYRAENDQYWGDLKLTQHSGTIFMGSNFLIDMKYARRAVGDFKAKCANMEAIQISSWLALPLKENNNIVGVSNVLARSSAPVNCNPDAIMKVQEWVAKLDRTETVASNAAAEITSHLPLLKISDVGFDDSASNKNLAINKKSITVGRMGQKFEGQIPAAPCENAFNFALGTKTSSISETKSNEDRTNYDAVEQPFIEATHKPTQQNCNLKKVPDEIDNPSTPTRTQTNVKTSKSFKNRFKRALDGASMDDTNKASQVNREQSHETSLVQIPSEQPKIQTESNSSPAEPDSSSKTKRFSIKGKYMAILLEKQKAEASLNSPRPASITPEIQKSYSPELDPANVVTSTYFENGKNPAGNGVDHNLFAPKNFETNYIDPQPNQPDNRAVPDKKSVDANHPDNLKRKYDSLKPSPPSVQCKMLPAGYDFQNLVEYNNENHWHRKPTTRNDRFPCDINNRPIRAPGLTGPRTEQMQEGHDSPALATAHTRCSNGSAIQLSTPSEQENKFNEILKQANYESEVLGIKNVLSFTNNYNAKYGQLNKEKHNNELEAKLKPLASAQKSPEVTQAELFNASFGENEFSFKRHAHVLAHSKMKLHSLDSFKETKFADSVTKAMQSLRITKLYRIQAYAWLHAPRGNSVFIVNPSESGKTWTCMAGICSTVSYLIEHCHSFSYGPVAVFLVATSQHVEKVTYYCNRMMGHITKIVPVLPSFGKRNEMKVEIQLLNSCGILVTTPSNLLRLLKKGEEIRLFDPKRLAHFIIDDMDLMLSRSQEDFRNAVSKLVKMTRIPGAPASNLQILVTSREWDPYMAPLIKMTDSILLIGDFLEATVYSKSNMSLKFCASDKKFNEIIKFIEVHPLQRERSIIFCNCDEEVNTVKQTLTGQGFCCISYNQYSTAEEREKIDEWTRHVLPTPEILVCTDLDFPELEVRNANNVIHYSLSHNWTKFTKRFSAMAAVFEDFVSLDFKKPMVSGASKTSSLVLLDESNNIQLPRLIRFMQKHGQTKHIDPRILSVAQQVVKQTESERNLLCPMRLEFGLCELQNCEYRHMVSDADAVTKDEQIPGTGDLRVRILKVHSPVHFSARLQEFRAPGASTWQELRYTKEGPLFVMQLSLHYQKPDNCIPHWPLHKNDLCVYKASESLYQRARVLKVSVLSKNKINAHIKLIDEGTVLERVLPSDLYVCDNKFKAAPPQAIDLRLLGVVPFDNEPTWDSKATDAVQQWLVKSLTETQSVCVKVKYAISNNIWTGNVVVMDYMKTLQCYTYHLDLKKSLIQKNFGVTCQTQSESVRGFIEPVLTSSEATTEIQAINVAPPLDDAPIAEMSKNDVPKSKPDDDKIAAKKIDVKPTQSIQKPFEQNPNHLQEASLAYRESWCDLPLNDYAAVEIGNEAENGNWNELYMQRIDTKSLEQFEKLSEIVAKHVDKLQHSGYTFDESLLKPLQNCIVKYEEQYHRAKVHSLFGRGSENCFYRFFLCDYAVFTDIKHGDVCKNTLYPSSKEIVEFTSFQAVHCQLTGVKLDWIGSAKRYKVKEPYLYAYTVAANTAVPSKVADLKIRSFQILLYDCADQNNPAAGNLLNQKLIDNKVATVDPETEHFLIKAQSMADTFATLLNCVKASLELDDQEEIEGFAKDLVGVPSAVERENPILSSIPEKPKEIVRDAEKTSAKLEKTPPKKSKETDLQKNPPVEKVENESDWLPPLTPLICNSKHPQVKWYETKSLICLKIYAPDITVKDYELIVRKRSISYYGLVNNEEQRFHLNLLGTLEPEYTSHEIRGLNVVVRLLKSYPVIWPRLLDNNEKLPWFSYDYDAINADELEHLLPQQHMQWTKPRNISNDSDSDADSELEMFQDYAPLRNKEDVFDPTLELC